MKSFVFQFGERCGGFANEAGECAGGLGCLIKYYTDIYNSPKD